MWLLPPVTVAIGIVAVTILLLFVLFALVTLITTMLVPGMKNVFSTLIATLICQQYELVPKP